MNQTFQVISQIPGCYSGTQVKQYAFDFCKSVIQVKPLAFLGLAVICDLIIILTRFIIKKDVVLWGKVNQFYIYDLLNYIHVLMELALVAAILQIWMGTNIYV